MRITLVGSRHFGVTTLQMLRQHEVDVIRVVVADADDRLAATARDAGIEVVVQANPKLVAASEIGKATDLIKGGGGKLSAAGGDPGEGKKQASG